MRDVHTTKEYIKRYYLHSPQLIYKHAGHRDNSFII